jgi:hypothetical protein
MLAVVIERWGFTGPVTKKERQDSVLLLSLCFAAKGPSATSLDWLNFTSGVMRVGLVLEFAIKSRKFTLYYR